MNETTNRKKPSAAWYLIAVLLFIIGPVSGISIIAHSFYKAFTSGIEFQAPGIATINIDKPGNYILWSQSEQKLTPTQIKNISITVRALPNNQAIEVKTIKTSHEKIDDTQRTSFAEVEIEQAGQYQVNVAGFLPDQSFLLRHSIFSNVIWSVLKGVFLFLVGVIGGIIIALVTFIRRTNYTTRSQQAEIIAEPSVETPEKPIEQTIPTIISTSTEEEHGRIWAMIAHLSAFAGFLFPFGNIIAPLIVWLLLRGDYPFVNEQGKESLNFQISIIIYSIIAFILFIVLIGMLLLPLIGLFMFVAVIVASIESARGKHFKYPLSIRFIK